MTDAPVAEATCVICGRFGTRSMEPPRRTFARGPDPSDPTYSVIGVLPDFSLCDEHYEDVHSGELAIGWCDTEGCRLYGERDERSPCGEPYKALKR